MIGEDGLRANHFHSEVLPLPITQAIAARKICSPVGSTFTATAAGQVISSTVCQSHFLRLPSGLRCDRVRALAASRMVISECFITRNSVRFPPLIFKQGS